MKRSLLIVSSLLYLAGLNSQVLPDSVTTSSTSKSVSPDLVGFSMDDMGQIKFDGVKSFYGPNTFRDSTSFGSLPKVSDNYCFTESPGHRLFVGEYRLFPKDNWFYLAPMADSGLKMNSLGKIRILSYDGFTETNLFNDDLQHELYPPYQYVPVWYRDAALTIRTNGSRSLHSVVTQAGGIEGIRSDVFYDETMPYTAYRIVSNKYSSLIFSVKADGSIYSAAGMLQLAAPAVASRSAVNSIDRKMSSLHRISALNSITYDSQEIKEGNGAQTNSVKSISTSENNFQRIGLLAEEVESVIPEAVRTLPDGRKGIWYSDVVSVLVDAVKELSAKVDSLQACIAQPSQEAQSRSIKSSPKENATTDPQTNAGAELYQNTPNPFNTSTEIRFRLPEAYSKALICIYSLQGSQLEQYDVTSNSGTGTISLQASAFAPGLYLYALIIDGKEIDCKRMTITN